MRMGRPTGNHIVMVAYTYYPWDPRVRREAETLVREGRAVTVVCARAEGQQSEDSVAGVRVRRVPLRIARGNALRYLYQYAIFLLLATRVLMGFRRRGLLAIHAHSLPDFIAFAALGPRLRGIPLVLDLHEAMPEIYLARFPGSRVGYLLALAAERVSCLLSNRVIVVNETIRELLAARGVPVERLVVVYNSPAAAEGVGVVPASLPVRTEGKLCLVYAGGVDRERDVASLVGAIGKIRNVRSVVLLIYGHGPPEYRAYLEGLVDGLGLRDDVHFCGVLSPDRVLAHLAHADVGVLTYESNPLTEVALPNKVFEYALLDKPLVLPNLRAMAVAFQGAARFYRPGDSDDLAANILAAASGGPEVRAQRERARGVCDATKWDVQAGRLAGVYRSLGARAAGG